MKNKYIFGKRASGKNYQFTIDIAKIISKTYKIPFNSVIKELFNLQTN